MEPMQLRDLAHKHGLDVIDFYVLMEFAKEIEELEREECARIAHGYCMVQGKNYSLRIAGDIRARGEK
jgi:phage anti-repressor protein